MGMATIKEAYTAAELAVFLGQTERALQIRAKRESWRSRPRSGRGGGHEWLVASMPEATRLAIQVAEHRAVRQSQPAEVQGAAIPAPALDAKRRAQALAKADLVRLYMEWQRRHGATVRAKREFVEAYQAGAWPQLRETLGASVSWQSLERWKLQQEREGSVMVLADRRGLAHRGQSMLTPGHREVLLAAALNPNAPKISYAVREAMARFRAANLPLPSDATCRRFLDRYISECHHEWTFVREGKKAWNDKCAFYIERDWSLVGVGDVVIADGHILNFESVNPDTGKPCRMMLVLWFDGASNYPVGWEIMPTENVQTIAAAFRRACITLGKFPRVAYLDNGKAFRAKFFQGVQDFRQAQFLGLFEELGVQVVHAWAYHGQSKPIERFFGSFHELEVWAPSYVGNSIEAKPARMKRGENLHRAAYAASGGRPLTLEETHEAVARYIDAYVRRPSRAPHLKGRTPLEVFQSGVGPGVDLARLDLLMLSREIKTIGRNGVSLRGAHYYAPELYGRRHPVVIRYDAQALDSVLIYTTDGAFLCEARRMDRNQHPVAEILGSPEQQASLQEAIAVKKSQERLAGASARQMFRTVVRPETQRRLEALDAPEAVVNIPRDYVRHLDNERPSETETLVAETPEVLAKADKVLFQKDMGLHGKRYAAVLTSGDQATVVVFDHLAGSRGNRIIPVTAYKANAKAADEALAWRQKGVKGEPSAEVGPEAADMIRAISALDEGSIDDSMPQGKARWSVPHAQAAGPGLDVEAVRRALAPLQDTAANAAPLEVVADVSALPEHLRAQAEQGGGRPEAVFDPGTGKVFVLADAVDSPERAVGLWLHEQGLHVGLRGLFGQDAARLDGFLDQTFEHFGAESFTDLAQAHGLDLATEDGRRRAAEERLAVLAEKVNLGEALDEREQGLWDRLKEMVRAWLRERGVDVGISDADIARTVMDAVRWTIQGDGQNQGRTLYQGPKLEQALKIGERVVREAKAWAESVDQFLAGTLKRSDPLRVGSTPEVLQAVGAQDLPMEMTQRKASKILRDKHGLPADILKGLPRLLAEPVAVFDSATMANSLVVLTEARDEEGKPVIAAVHLAVREGHHEVNEIASVYGKDGFSGWFKREVGDGRLRYIDKRKAAAVAESGELQSLKERTYRGGRQKVLTEADIVKPILSGELNQRALADQDAPRAAVSFLEDGRALIRLFRTADATSVIHEAAHVIRPFLPAEDLAVVERWAGVEDGNWTVQAEEKFARAFERYCMEAKAPTARLRQVLSKLRGMLVRVYGNLKALGVDPIPDDVRAVFDRMLSTEKEREAERRTLDAIHSFRVDQDAQEASYEEPPAHPSDITEWSDLMAEAERRAQANFDRERRKELRALRAAWRAEAREVADNHPAHWVMDRVKSMGVEGLSQDYDHDTIMALNQKRPGLVRRGALPYDMAMQAAGVEDSDAMIMQILEAPTKAQIIQDWMEQREAEYLRLKAQSEDFGQDYFAVQDAALDILGQMTEKRVEQVRRQRAKAEVDEMLASDLGRTGQRLRTERKNLLAQAKAAFDSGDRAGALRAMNRLRDSDTLLREVERARLERETIARSVSASLARRIPEEYREQALAWAGRMGARNVGAAPRQTLLEFLHFKKLLPFVNRDAIAVLEKYPHTAWSVDQYRYAKDVLRQIVHFGATEGKLLAGKEARDYEQAVAGVLSAIKAPPRPDVAIHPVPVNERRPGSFGRFLEGTNRAMAQMLKAAHIFRCLVGGRDMGPVWTACMKPLADARNEFLRLGEEASSRLEAALAPVRERMGQWRKQKLTIKEIPRNIIQKRSLKNGQWTTEVQAGVPLLLSRESVFMAALNMGNLGNREALKAGYMWTEGDLAAISKKLTAEEWKMVQDVWDTIDGLYPHLNAVHKKLTGVTLRKVEAAPFQVQTADGQSLEIRGGYFPLQFDRELSVRADQLGAVADIMEETRGVHFNPRPARGMTIERQGGRMAPLLSFEVISRHLLDTVHYVSHALAIRDVDRIILDPRFRETVEAARGKDEYAQIRPWLQNVARPSREPRTVLELWMRRLRKNVQFAALAYRIPTAMIQLTSLTSTVNSLGFWPTARAAVSVLTSPSESWAFANDRSIALRNRRRSFDRDVVNNLGRFQAGWGNVSDTMLEWGMMPIGLVDSLAAHVTWLAAYKKAMDANGWDEAKACEYADMTVRMSQGEGASMSLSQVQSKPALELVTVFFSWFNTNYNNIVAAHRALKFDGGTRLALARSAFWLLVAPVVMESLWKKGVPDDGDDWEELGKDVLTYVLAHFPLLRDIATPMITGYRPRFSPVQVAWEAPGNLVNAFQAKKDRGRKVAKAAMQFAGAFTIFPTTAAITAMNGALDLIQGKTKNPARLLFPAQHDEKKKKKMTYGGGK
jgi:putative transposase